MYLYNKSLWKYLYIISMALAFTTRYADIKLGFELQMFIGLFWIAVAFLKLEKNKFAVKNCSRQDLIFFFEIYFIPRVVIHLYSIMLIVLGKIESSFFSTNVTVYIPTLLVIFSIYLFGTKAFKYNCYALIVSWALSVSASFICKGPYVFVFAIKQAYFDVMDNTFSNYLELHDLVLAMGYIVIFYYISREKLTKKNIFVLLLVLLIMILGFKRIAVLGVIIVMFLYFIFKQLGIQKQYKICIMLGWIGFLLCYGFIFIMSKGPVFFDMLAKFGINPMGRNYYYMEIMKYAEFKIDFLGIGRNSITQILNTDLSYLRVGGVHSDIIKMYVENGFVLFGLWLWFSLVKVTKLFKKRFGMKSAVIYFMITIYTFSLYLTDNIEIYFICQILAMIIPMTYALKDKERNREEKNYANK